MKLKKLWNNRTFRTFIQTFLGVLIAYFADYAFELDSKKVLSLIIMATATSLSKIMPLFNEEEKVKDEVTE